MRIAFVISKLPYPPDEGTKIAYYNHLLAFAHLGYEVSLYTLAGTPRAPVAAEISKLCKKVTVLPLRQRYRAILRRPDLPFSVATRYSPELVRALTADAISGAYDLIFAENPPMEVNVESRPALPVATVYRTNDLAYEVYAGISRELPCGLRRALYRLEGVRLRSYQLEQNRIAAFDANIFARRDNAVMMQTLYPRSQQKYYAVPLCVDIEKWTKGVAVGDREEATPRVKRVLFTGNMSYGPNVSAVLRFASDIWPFIKRRFPNSEFTVAGRDPGPGIRWLAAQDPSIRVTGALSSDRMQECFRVADLVVIPIEYGAGFRYKAVEALAAGKVIVTTPFAVKGLDIVPGEHVLAAHGSHEFTKLCLEVLENPERFAHIGRAGQQFATRTYSIRAMACQLDSIFNAVMQRRRKLG